MRSHRRLLRLGAWLASSSLCLTTLAPALAQPAPPAGELAGDQGTDPPSLVGRLATLNGSVSFHTAGETQWNAATLNYPVTTGTSLWTEPQAGASIEIADNRLVLDDSTELDIGTLDQSRFSATEPQGAVFLQLASLPSGQGGGAGQGVSFDTPRGTVQITAPGRYEIVAGDTNDATTVTVVEGAAHVTANNLSLDIGPQQTAIIGGTDTLQGNVGAMQQDAFLQAQLRGQERRVAAPLPQTVRYMTGASDLQQYGSFSQTAQYGQVWYPNDVAQDWAPYRDGHWAYVQPWGWTWVDNARWGFAPFHYGRWVQVNDRWGWVGYGGGGGDESYGSDYPVYSPALVSFVDVGGAALAGAAIGFAAGELAGGYAPGWIPLGPREPYYPWYHARGDYFGRINRPYGVPRDIIARGPVFNTVNIHQTNVFINRRFATVAPAGAFARGQSMRGIARPLPERALAEARPAFGRLPVRPTAFTPNLAPSAARRFNVDLSRTPVRPVTAGPRIEAGRPGRAPELRRASLPGNIHAVPQAQVQGRAGAGRGPEARPGPVIGARPGAPGPQIGQHGPGGLPGLRAPGARPEAMPPGGARETRLPGAAGEHAAPGGIAARPEAGPRPGAAARPEADRARPPELRAPGNGPAQAARGAAERGAGAPEPARPAGLPHGAEQRATPRPAAEAPRPAQRVEPARPAPRPEAPRVQAPRPEPRAEAPRVQAPRPVPRPAPHVEAPRPPPRAEAPRPPPRAEAPRPAPRAEAPRPAPRMEAPRPPPARPAPAAHPAPAPGRREPPH